MINISLKSSSEPGNYCRFKQCNPHIKHGFKRNHAAGLCVCSSACIVYEISNCIF